MHKQRVFQLTNSASGGPWESSFQQRIGWNPSAPSSAQSPVLQDTFVCRALPQTGWTHWRASRLGNKLPRRDCRGSHLTGNRRRRMTHEMATNPNTTNRLHSLVVPEQNGCLRPPLMQKSTWPIRPPSPYLPAFVCTTCTAFACPLSNRLPFLISGRAGSSPMIFSMRKFK